MGSAPPEKKMYHLWKCQAKAWKHGVTDSDGNVRPAKHQQLHGTADPEQCLSSSRISGNLLKGEKKSGIKGISSITTSFSNEELARRNSQGMVRNRQHLVLFRKNEPTWDEELAHPFSCFCLLSKCVLDCPACRSRFFIECPNICWKWRPSPAVPTQSEDTKIKQMKM